MTTNPPAPHNWDRIPRIQHLDDFFHRKYHDVGEGEESDLRSVATAEDILAASSVDDTSHIHLPSPSYWPLVLAMAFPLIGFGVIYHLSLAAVGGVVLLGAAFGWALEPSTAPADG